MNNHAWSTFAWPTATTFFAYIHLNDKVASGGGLSWVPKLGPKAPVIWSWVPVTALSPRQLYRAFTM